MAKTRLRICAGVLLCLLQTQACVVASGQRNLALHKRIDYSPKPEYRLTVDSRDPFELTDGVKDKSLWYRDYREKTVGWMYAPLVEMNVDLGEVYDVGLVNIYTVGGGQSGVEYPEYAAVAVSLDGTNYGLSSYSTSDGWAFGTKNAIPKTFVLPVDQKARYIRLFVRPIESFFFADEIEVLESQRDLTEDSVNIYLGKSQMIDLIERARELERGRDILSEDAQKLLPEANGLSSDWQTIKEKISLLGRNPTEVMISQSEAAFAQFRARWLKSKYEAEWLCCPAEPIDILRYSDLPQSAPNNVQLSLYQWRNEHGVAAINVTNCSMTPITFIARFSPLRCQDKTIGSAGILELRRGLYVRVLNAGLVADPLVLQNSKPFLVAPAQTVQLWVEAYSKALGAGVYTAAVAIDASGDNITKTRQTIQVILDIADKTFPDKVPLYSCNWDYVTISDRFTSKTPDKVKEAISDLENHYINVAVIRFDRVFDQNGPSLSSKTLSDELALRSSQKPFALIFLGGQSHLERRFGAFRTPAWESRFKAFLVQLRDSMLNNGSGYDSFAIYPFDEYIGDDFVYVAQMIRDCDPKIRIYANRWFESDSQFRQVKDLIDIWCPYSSEVLANKSRFEYYREHGGFDRIWCYNTTLACKYVFAPPYIRKATKWDADSRMFWRLLPIVAAYSRMDGVGFWVYQDSDSSGWTKERMGDYGVIYDGSQIPDGNCLPEAIVPSKRWQQWREGIEDAVCLMGHKELLDEFARAPGSELTSEYLASLRRRADAE